MGGPVSIAVRTEDGQVHSFDAWTGFLRHFSKGLGFYEKDPAYIQRYLNELREHADPGPVAPAGYGLVVYDFASDHILTLQDYTTVEIITSAMVCNMVGQVDGDPEDLVELRRLFEAGRLTQQVDPHTGVAAPDLPLTWEGWIAALHTRASNHRFEYNRYAINTDPFTVLDFAQNSTGTARQFRQMRLKLLDLGFTLSNIAEKQWEAEILDWETFAIENGDG